MKKRIVKTEYGDVWMNPPYLSCEYMDNDAGIMRAWVARKWAERWYADYPEFDRKTGMRRTPPKQVDGFAFLAPARSSTKTELDS